MYTQCSVRRIKNACSNIVQLYSWLPYIMCTYELNKHMLVWVDWTMWFVWHNQVIISTNVHVHLNNIFTGSKSKTMQVQWQMQYNATMNEHITKIISVCLSSIFSYSNHAFFLACSKNGSTCEMIKIQTNYTSTSTCTSSVTNQDMYV